MSEDRITEVRVEILTKDGGQISTGQFIDSVDSGNRRVIRDALEESVENMLDDLAERELL
jgi:hypothetical protein